MARRSCLDELDLPVVADTSVVINVIATRCAEPILDALSNRFHRDVQANLGRDGLTEAVFNALRLGRMRVLPHHLSWVVDLIGPERARQCPSLPSSVRRD